MASNFSPVTLETKSVQPNILYPAEPGVKCETQITHELIASVTCRRETEGRVWARDFVCPDCPLVLFVYLVYLTFFR